MKWYNCGKEFVLPSLGVFVDTSTAYWSDARPYSPSYFKISPLVKFKNSSKYNIYIRIDCYVSLAMTCNFDSLYSAIASVLGEASKKNTVFIESCQGVVIGPKERWRHRKTYFLSHISNIYANFCNSNGMRIIVNEDNTASIYYRDVLLPVTVYHKDGGVCWRGGDSIYDFPFFLFAKSLLSAEREGHELEREELLNWVIDGVYDFHLKESKL